MTIHEQEAEEALGKWSSSKYAVLEHSRGVKPMLLPQNHPNKDFNKGVGTPYLVQHPEDPSKYTLLFTGWNTDDGSDRKVYAADFDPTTWDLENFRTLLTGNDFPNSTTEKGADVVHAAWDAESKEWILSCTVSSSVSGIDHNMGFARLDEGLTDVVETAEYHPISVIDSGVPVVTAVRRMNAMLTVSTEDALKEIVADDFTKLPAGTADLTVNQEIVKGGSPEAPILTDVHQTFRIGNSIVIIAERQKPNWHLSAGVLPTVASAGTGLADDVRVPMSEAPFLAQNFTTGGGHTGHPHYTTLLGRPILMFAWFRGFESPSGTADRHRHEIWVQSLPADPFSPERLAPRASLAVVDANESGLWMPTYGRDATVFLGRRGGGRRERGPRGAIRGGEGRRVPHRVLLPGRGGGGLRNLRFTP